MVVLAAGTWRRWPDIMIDFGHGLYIPWQLSLGKVLYVDIAYVFGPLSQYWHAGLFYVFGPSFTVLIASNLALIALETWLLYTIFRKIANEVAGLTAAICFLAAFGFAQLTPVGNYNFASPYTPEVTHGIVLLTAMVLALLHASESGSARWMAAAGLALGAASLTKQEVFAAGAAAAAVWAALEYSRRRIWRSAICVFGCAAAVAVLAWGVIAALAGLPAATAALSAYGRIAADSHVAGMPFYRAGMGLDRPVLHIAFMLVVSAVWVIAGWAIYRLALLGEARSGLRYRVPAILLGAITLALLWGLSGAGLLAGTAVILFLARRSPLDTVPARIWIVWAVFALALMPKMLLAPRIFHYGFYLGMPAFILAAVFLTHHAPDALPLTVRGKLRYRRLAAGFLLLGMLRITATSQIFFYSPKTTPVGEGGDVILAASLEPDPRTGAVRALLEELKRSAPPSATLAVLPEGVMLNYLSRRANPTSYINFMPLVMAAYGEPRVLDSLKRHPPDYIILFHRNTAEFGTGLFGRDPAYGRKIRD